jgi:hypothetical protein
MVVKKLYWIWPYRNLTRITPSCSTIWKLYFNLGTRCRLSSCSHLSTGGKSNLRQNTGWTPEMFWKRWWRENQVPTEKRTLPVQFIACHFTYCTTMVLYGTKCIENAEETSNRKMGDMSVMEKNCSCQLIYCWKTFTNTKILTYLKEEFPQIWARAVHSYCWLHLQNICIEHIFKMWCYQNKTLKLVKLTWCYTL